MRCSSENHEVSVGLDLPAQVLEPAIREVAAVLRRNRLSYDQSRYVVREARRMVGLKTPRRPERLPRGLSDEELQRFFAAVRKGGVAEHELMFRVCYVTGARVAELTRIQRDDVDLANCLIRIEQGKGSRDRMVMFPASLILVLRLHLESTRGRKFLFETNRGTSFSARWVQTLARRYGDLAGIGGMHPHRLRHTLLTQLASGRRLPSGERLPGMGDAQLAAVSGHRDRSSLDVYSSLTQRAVIEAYQDHMDR